MPTIETHIAVRTRRHRPQGAVVVGLLFTLVVLSPPAPANADEAWVSSIVTSDDWAYSQCTDYWVTVACGMVKDYSDPGNLPRVISVGDVVRFRERKGKLIEFTVRHINYYVYDKDVSTNWGSAKKGETTCMIYAVRSRTDSDASKYPSVLFVKQCQIAQ